MHQDTIDMQVESLTVDTVGEFGDRTILLQGQSGDDVLTLIIDHEQAAELAFAGSELLNVLSENYPRELDPFQVPSPEHMSLQTPIRPLFQVAQFQLGYDDRRDQAVLITIELPLDDETGAENLRVVRFWIAREQLVSLIRQIEHVVDTEIPLCPACREPLEARGHNCVRNN